MALRSIVPMQEATQDEKIIYKFAMDINRVWLQKPDGRDFEAVLYDEIREQLAKHVAFLGHWEIAWGPAVVQFDTSLFPVNAMCVLRSLEDTSRYIAAVSATNALSPFSWIVEDFLVAKQVPWETGLSEAPAAQISLSTAIGLQILLQAFPHGNRPGAGTELIRFLGNLAGKGIDLTVTGVSLGGTLSATLALYLSDIRRLWGASEEAKISAMAICGATAGNRAFAEYSERALPSIVRYANTLDIVPNFWNLQTLEATKTIYQPHIPIVPAINNLLDGAKLLVAKGDYSQLERVTTIQGTFNPQAKLPGQDEVPKQDFWKWVAQAGYQHVGAYDNYFERPKDDADLTQALLAPRLIFNPAVQYAAKQAGVEIPKFSGMDRPLSGPLTIPIDGQPTAVRSSSDSKQMAQIATEVSSALQKAAKIK